MAVSKYQRIADDLLLQMRQGTLRPGDKLPSEPELCQTYGASRNTVRGAIAALTNRGLVVPQQGLGTFVADEIVPYVMLLSEEQGWQDNGQGDAYISAVRMAGRNPEELRVVVEVQHAPDDVAERLDITAGESVVRRHAERLIDGRPWSMLSSYYPLDIARGTRLAQAGTVSGGVIRLLAELGYEQVGYRDEVSSRMPDLAEYNFFQLVAGVPIIVVDRTAYDARRPIRFTRHIYPGDRNRIAYDLGKLPDPYGGPPKQPPPPAGRPED
jgi:GntR family transcriptional regulator